MLEQRADSDDRKSMSLLWLARDYLPAVLAAPPSGNPEAESKVQEHLAIICQEQQGAAQRLTIEDWWTRVIVVLDVIAVMAAIVYFVRKRMAR